MELKGHYTFDATLDAVWTLLMDTAAIATCTPGCRELRGLGDDRYHADLVVVIAAVTGAYQATIAIEEKEPPRAYTLVVEANGQRGFVRGRAAIALEEDDGKTLVLVNATAQVGGAVARVGQRLLQGTARMLMDRFFKCLRRKLGQDELDDASC